MFSVMLEFLAELSADGMRTGLNNVSGDFYEYSNTVRI